VGCVRFALAMLVAISHVPEVFLPINVGVVSVIGFYFISGYLMRLSFARFAELSPRPVAHFYRDRFLKIFPAYWTVVAATLLAAWLLGPTARTDWPLQLPTAIDLLANLAVIPLNYNLASLGLVPPAWSLAVELQFYLLVPWLFRLSPAWRGRLLALSAAAQLAFLSFATTSDAFGYRYLVGVLPAFLTGFMLAATDPRERAATWLAWLAWLGYLVFVAFPFGTLKHTHAKEVLFGLMVAAPAVFWVLHARLPLPAGYATLDRTLGDLAYPVFLVHFLALYLLGKLAGGLASGSAAWFGAYYGLTLLLAWAVHRLAQAPSERLRLAVRHFPSLKSGGA